MTWIYDDEEAIDKSVAFLKGIETVEQADELIKMLTTHDDRFPMCSNAYARKLKCAYASVCDCCQITYYHHDICKFSCTELKPIQWLMVWTMIERRSFAESIQSFLNMFIEVILCIRLMQ
jgi:hypothetical protein